MIDYEAMKTPYKCLDCGWKGTLGDTACIQVLVANDICGDLGCPNCKSSRIAEDINGRDTLTASIVEPT